MKLSGFLMAVGFLTLSAAVPAPTPIYTTELNAIPASGTMTNLEAAMPEPTLMPRYDADAICNKLRSGNYREWRVLDEGTRLLMPRMSPEEIESFCNDLKQGNVEVSTIPS